MSEFISHPEVQQLRLKPEPENHAERGSRPGAVVRAAKFAFAALVAGSRAIPLGDNGCITRELGAYGARLRMQ